MKVKSWSLTHHPPLPRGRLFNVDPFSLTTLSNIRLAQTPNNVVGSGCGSVGRAVASKSRGPRFESSHRQKFIFTLNICLLSTVYCKDKNKEKEAGNGPFLTMAAQCKY